MRQSLTRKKHPSAQFVIAKAEAIHPKLIRVRRQMHRFPELGYQEIRTTRMILKELSHIGIKATTTKQGIGALATLKGKFPGKTVALRADIDALPVHEKTGLPYASKNKGVMHACGHDAHTAALLGAAEILSQYNKSVGLKGNVRLIFQPNEEHHSDPRSGAHLMLKEGAMRGVNAAFGAHVINDLATGTISSRKGSWLASAGHIEITIKGKSVHTGKKVFNPLHVQAIIIGELQKKYGPKKGNLVQAVEVSQFPSTHVTTQTPSKVTLKFRIGRLGTPKQGQQFIQDLIQDIRKIVRKDIFGSVHWRRKSETEKRIKENPAFSGTSVTTKFYRGTPLLYNDHELEKIVKNVTKDIGLKHKKAEQIMGADDFSVLGRARDKKGRHIPIMYAATGAKTEPPTEYHHDPTFRIHEDSIKHQAALLAQSAIRYLNG